MASDENRVRNLDDVQNAIDASVRKATEDLHAAIRESVEVALGSYARNRDKDDSPDAMKREWFRLVARELRNAAEDWYHEALCDFLLEGKRTYTDDFEEWLSSR